MTEKKANPLQISHILLIWGFLMISYIMGSKDQETSFLAIAILCGPATLFPILGAVLYCIAINFILKENTTLKVFNAIMLLHFFVAFIIVLFATNADNFIMYDVTLLEAIIAISGTLLIFWRIRCRVKNAIAANENDDLTEEFEDDEYEECEDETECR